tara:strand:- start:105 stop:1553 length:1449 start_codon:yes stop_codon:yes gene_type:complete
MKKQTNKEFLDNIWSINPSYKERFCYELCIYTTAKNKIKVTCKKHNCLFETLPYSHIKCAKKEIKENIILPCGCNECYQLCIKQNTYSKTENNKPLNYNENDWKLISNFENYFIHKNGTVFSKLSNKNLKPYLNECGYLVVSLHNKKTSRTNNHLPCNYKKRVHILVAETFVNNPNPEIYNIVNHKDSNKSNPLYTNLEWTNKSGNKTHSDINKMYKTTTRNEISVINNNNNIIKHFNTHKECAKWLKVSDGCLSNYFNDIKNNKVRKYLIENNLSLKKIVYKPNIKLIKHNLDIEIWKEILPDGSNYFISNFGNVKTKKNNISPFYAGGYLFVTCNKIKYQIHKLVLKYHLKVNYNTNDLIIDHLDGNKKNNYIGNLEWVTHSINSKRAIINGQKKVNRKIQKVECIRIVDRPSKYRIGISFDNINYSKSVKTKKEAIQVKKEFYAYIVITNYIKFKKGLYTKYCKLNINFNDIDNEIKLL